MLRRAALAVTAIAALGTACKKAESEHHPLFFAIDKDGTTSYVLGTIHRGVDANAWLPPSVFAKLDAAKAFASETDTKDPALADAIVRTEGSLHADIGDDHWKKLEATVGAPTAARLDHLVPFVTVATLVIRNMPQTPPMDGDLLSRAQSEGKSLVYLEPASKQVALLIKWLTSKTVVEILDDADASKTLETEMLAAYLDGDADEIAAIQERDHAIQRKHGHSAAEQAQQQKELVDDRNASWIDAIDKMHANGGGFIAVGALHLVGPNSVPALLAKRGYTVKRL